MTTLKHRLKATPGYPLARRLHRKAKSAQRELGWRFSHKAGPTPPAVKQRALRRAARTHALRAFVETGTFRGETTAAMTPGFDRIWSIELHDGNFEYCRERFASQQKVNIVRGDSRTILPLVLAELDRPALFWLDAHDSGPGTAKSDDGDPPAAELETIFAHHIKSHVVYIDDAKTFRGVDGYPTVDEISARVAKERPGWAVTVKDDIIRIEPAR